MTIQKAVAVLNDYNKWRKGIGEYKNTKAEVTKAIDKILGCFNDISDRAKEIRDYRIRMKYDQLYLSSLLGICQPKLSKIENGITKVDDDTWHEFELIRSKTK